VYIYVYIYIVNIYIHVYIDNEVYKLASNWGGHSDSLRFPGKRHLDLASLVSCRAHSHPLQRAMAGTRIKHATKDGLNGYLTINIRDLDGFSGISTILEIVNLVNHEEFGFSGIGVYMTQPT